MDAVWCWAGKATITAWHESHAAPKTVSAITCRSRGYGKGLLVGEATTSVIAAQTLTKYHLSQYLDPEEPLNDGHHV